MSSNRTKQDRNRARRLDRQRARQGAAEEAGDGPSLYHLTVNTAHSRISPRSEVRDDVVAMLRQRIAEADLGHVPLDDVEPGAFARLSVEPDISAYGVELGLTFGGERLPVVMSVLCVDPEHTAAVWRHAQRSWAKIMRELPPVQMPPADRPWLAAMVLPSALARQDALFWMGDAERCLAWALIESREWLEVE